MNRVYNWYLLGWIVVILPAIAMSQTCCSGGVPVSANLGLPTVDKGTWQTSLSYDFNRLSTLKTGRETIADASRNRTTHSFLLELGHTFTNRFSVDVLMSIVRQERRIVQQVGTDESITNGIGDATLLVKYLLLNQPRASLSVGLGAKAPLGATNKSRQDGIQYSADLQPGSGAWDGIVWLSGSHAGVLGEQGTFFGSFIFSAKGKNNSYLVNQEYQFGNELQILLGLGHQVVMGSSLVSPSMGFRYRNAKADRINTDILPSSGGNWIFLNPSVTYAFNPSLSWQINMDIPLFADIVGTQVTPTYRINTGIYFIFN